METFLLCLGKTALAMGVFYIAYFVLFKNQKQFRFNRIYLLSSLTISFVIPVITFTVIREVNPQVITEISANSEIQEIASNHGVQPSWIYSLFLIYAAGFAGFLLYLLAGHLKACAIIRHSSQAVLFGTKVHVSEK